MVREKATLPWQTKLPRAQEYLNSSLWPVSRTCLESGKEAFTRLSDLNATLGMLEKGDIGEWLSESWLQRYY